MYARDVVISAAGQILHARFAENRASKRQLSVGHVWTTAFAEVRTVTTLPMKNGQYVLFVEAGHITVTL
jgi:hypothetical protein